MQLSGLFRQYPYLLVKPYGKNREGTGMNHFVHVVYNASMLVLVLLAGTAMAGQIYRSVDADGNVTFSSEAPANAATVEEVNVRPGPSAEAQREARERLQRQESTANEMGEARAGRTRQQPAASPGATDVVEPKVTEDQYYGNPNPKTGQGDKIRDRLPGRPVQLPVRPVPR
jgi:hypothetical protein